jgi:hypothetical protein
MESRVPPPDIAQVPARIRSASLAPVPVVGTALDPQQADRAVRLAAAGEGRRAA